MLSDKDIWMNNVATLPVQDNTRWFTPSQSLTDQIKIFNNLVKTAKLNGAAPCLLITPKLAEHLLLNNTGNRRQSTKALDLYQEAMEEDDWPVTGATIVVGKMGRILDGQHRLIACVNAGVPFMTYVVFGVDENNFDRIDTGRRRSNIDAFVIARVPHANHAAKAARWIAIFNNDPKDRGVTYTNNDLLTFYKKDLNQARFTDAIELALTVHKGCKLQQDKADKMPIGSTAAMFYFMLAKDAALARSFADMLATNSKKPAQSIYGHIREIKRFSNGRIHEVLRNAIVINAWNLLRANKAVTVAGVKWDGTREPFPAIK
jgi:hypothetical protein